MLRRRFLPALLAFAPFARAAGVPVCVATDVGAGEGPVWHDGWLWFTGANRISRWHEASRKVEVWKENAGGPNGLLFDSQGRLVACEGVGRRVVRHDLRTGSVEVLADSYNGKRLNSPNDLTADAQGRVYFSDPRYGNRDSMELDEEAVYRIDAPGRMVRVLGRREGVDRPNGVLVSRDGRYLYVADNNNSERGARRLLRFRRNAANGDVDAASRYVLYDWGASRGPDGLKTDPSGRLYVAAGRTTPRPPHESSEKKGGIYVLSSEGKLDSFLPVPNDEVTNCAFGGRDRKTLYITAGGNLWRSSRV